MLLFDGCASHIGDYAVFVDEIGVIILVVLFVLSWSLSLVFAVVMFM